MRFPKTTRQSEIGTGTVSVNTGASDWSRDTPQDKIDLSWAAFGLVITRNRLHLAARLRAPLITNLTYNTPCSGASGALQNAVFHFYLVCTGPGLARALSWLPARLPAPPEDVNQPVEALALAQPFYLGHCVLLALAAGYAGQNRVPDHLAPAELDPEVVARPPEAPPPTL